MAGNNQNEHDVIERRITFGPGIRALAYFISYAICFGAGWFTHSQIAKGTIAESEVKVRKDDGKVAIDIDRDLEVGTKRVEHEHRERAFDTDCADTSIANMRSRMRESEEHQ